MIPFPGPTLIRALVHAFAVATVAFCVSPPTCSAQVFPVGDVAQGRVRHVIGGGFANSGSYTDVGLLAPMPPMLPIHSHDFLSFIDGRIFAHNDSTLAGSVGLGGRYYFSRINRMLGANFAYVIDGTHQNTFHQFIVSAEMSGEFLDFNVNGHLPIGDRQQTNGFSPTSTTPTFPSSGTNILFARDRYDELAYSGITAELGFRLPGAFAEKRDIAAYAGFHHFGASDAPSFGGFSGRIAGRLSRNLSVQFRVTNDDEFGTNALVYLTWDWLTAQDGDLAYPMPDPDPILAVATLLSPMPPGRRSVRDRMTDFPERDHQVVVTEQTFSDPVIATITGPEGSGGPGGGGSGTTQTLDLFHVDSWAAPGGDGSLSSPFQTLAEAVANSGAGDIVYVHGDSVFDGERFALQDSQRLLGEGVDHFVETDQGTIQIPTFSPGTAAPIIRNSPAGIGTGAVTLASGAEVAGMSIEDSQGPAIYGDEVSGNVSIHDNTMQRVFRGIDIRNSSATVAVNNTFISNTTDDGILLTDNTGPYTFTGTTSVDAPGGLGGNPNGGVGISIQGNASTVTFEDVAVTNRSSTAIDIGRNTGTVAFNQPLTIANPNASQDEAIGIANSSGDVTFNDVTIDDTNRNPSDPRGPGMPSVVLANNSNTVTFNRLDISTSNGGALHAENIARLVIRDGVIEAVGGPAVLIDGFESCDIKFNSVSASNADVGILLGTDDGGMGPFRITGDGETIGSGGTMTNVDRGILIGNVDNAVFNFLDIASNYAGVTAVNTNNLVVNASRLSDWTFGSVSGWKGIDVFNNDDDKPGSPVIFTGNTIESAQIGAYGIRLVSDNAPPPGAIRIDDQRITLTDPGSVGVEIDAMIERDSDEFGPGDVLLISLQDNTITAGTPFVATSLLDNPIQREILDPFGSPVSFDPSLPVSDPNRWTQKGARTFGQLLINGQLHP